MRLEGTSGGRLVQQPAHSRAKREHKIAHHPQENLQGYLFSTQGVRICYDGPKRGKKDSLVRKYCQ